MVRYDGYFFAQELGGWNLLSKIKVSSSGKPWYLHSMASFVEQWHGGGFGDLRWGLFGPSCVEQVGGTDGWTQTTTATFSTSYGPDDPTNCFAMVVSDGPVQQWGMGVGVSLPQTPPGTVLVVRPSPYELPPALRQYSDLRSSGRLPRGCATTSCPDALQDIRSAIVSGFGNLARFFHP